MPRLLDLRPCDSCNGPVGQFFQVIRYSIAVVNVAAVNEFFGMHQFFGGRASPALVENFTPSAGDGFKIAMDDAKTRILMTEIYVCQSCYMEPLDLPRLAEVINERAKKSEGAAVAETDSV